MEKMRDAKRKENKKDRNIQKERKIQRDGNKKSTWIHDRKKPKEI